MNWLVNTIAMNEVYVARYYYERGAYVAAANRAQTVITDFEGAPATEEALYLMVQSYDKLGMTDLKNDAQRIRQELPQQQLQVQGTEGRQELVEPVLTTSRMGKKIPLMRGFLPPPRAIKNLRGRRAAQPPSPLRR